MNSSEREWQPIETAPRIDGKRVLVWSAFFETPMIAMFQIFHDHELWEGENGHRRLNPTHWMPLPTPPKEQEHG